MAKRLLLLFALVVTVALPFLLRPRRPARARTDDTLVIITPHTEAFQAVVWHLLVSHPVLKAAST